MTTSEILNKLKTLGLTSYEAKCYLALLGANELAATEVSKLSGVPRTRTYEVLENLLKKGLCNSVPGSVIRYSASDPSILKVKDSGKLEKIRKKINEHQKELKKCETEIINIEKNRDDAIAVLTDFFQKGQANTESVTYKYMEIVRNRSLLNEKISALIADAKREIRGLTATKPLIMVKYEKSELHAISKGVICKNIYEVPEDIERLELLIEEVKNSSKIGEVIKIVDHVPMDLLVFDDEQVMFSIKDPLPHIDSYTCMIAKHKVLAEFFSMAYQSIWDKAMDPGILTEILIKRKNQKRKS